MSASRIVDQLDALRNEHPRAPLVVFVPREQLGQAVEAALARRRRGWRDLRTLIPRHYAEDLARLDVLRSGRREAPVGAQLFRAARIVQALPADERVEALPGWHLLADTVAEALDTLREGDVEVASVQARAEEAAASETLGVIAACYDRYTRVLDDEGLYDDADLYRWAADRVRAGEAPTVPDTVYAVAATADLSEHAAQFLRALYDRAEDFVRLGVDTRSEPPPKTAAARFRDARLPDDSQASPSLQRQEQSEEGDRFVRAVGARREVQAVFRDLLRDDRSFGDAAIAYTQSRPYASLLADEAERVGVPLTMGTGLPAQHTRTGRALRGLYEWVRDEYDPAILIRMLRTGLLRTDRWRRNRDEKTGEASSPERPSLRPYEAATLLAERSYESGRDGLLGGLAGGIRSIENRTEDRATGALTDREETKIARLELLTAYVEALADLVPRSGEVRKMAKGSFQFLQRFGPTDAPTTPEEERTPDEAARGVLYQRLQRLADTDVSCEARDRSLAALFQQWLSGQYVQAESPRPGHVHVLPLESAGFSDRSHLHVVGLDSTTFAAPRAETGMLQETDRRALLASLDTDGALDSGGGTPADEALWRATRALRRHRGRTCFYTRIFDVEAGEERDPSSLFLQKERAHSSEAEGPSGSTDGDDGAPVVGLVPGMDAIPLSDGDQWLQAYRAGLDEGIDSDSASTARERVGKTYPWVWAGEAARQARQSDRYTAHDGLLSVDGDADLGLFGPDARPVSASRLETLAEAPYVYFLSYVLGVRPLDEPALDEEPWLNHRRKGALLHTIYERFMRQCDGTVTHEEASLLETIVDNVLKEETNAFSPPSEVVEQAARRELNEHASLFLRAEIDRPDAYVPDQFELGFGLPPHRHRSGDVEEAARLSVGEQDLRLRGRIDRVDRHRETGALTAWDYKTGGASSYDESEPLQDGNTLQWALYAYALESLLDTPVEASGYFFANVQEVGNRISADPNRYRADVDRLLQNLDALAESGSFPVAPRLTEVNAWAWGGYDRIVGDLRARKAELKEKEYPEDRPTPPSF